LGQPLFIGKWNLFEFWLLADFVANQVLGALPPQPRAIQT
jgi:hypothetical protein